MTLTDGVLDAETLATIRKTAEAKKDEAGYSWISPGWVLKILDRIGDLERRVRNANGAVVLATEVLAEALRRRSWAYVEAFTNRDGSEPVDLEEWSRIADVNYPGAAVEQVGDREELVIYTGLRVDPDTEKVRRFTDEEAISG